MLPTAFLEIEHKFVVDAGFDREALFAACRALDPEREKALTVTDTYYVPPGQANRIYRHRIDKEIQQLTLKSRGGDNEVRTEINLDLVLPAPKPTRWRRGWASLARCPIRHCQGDSGV